MAQHRGGGGSEAEKKKKKKAGGSRPGAHAGRTVASYAGRTVASYGAPVDTTPLLPEPVTRQSGDAPEAPPAGGPSDAMFSTSQRLAPLPSRRIVETVADAAEVPPTAGAVAWMRAEREREAAACAPAAAAHDPLPEMGTDEEVTASLGASVQLAARGAQNYHLDIHPEATLFSRRTRRHPPLACETFCESVQLGLGRTTTIELQKRGHVLGDCYLEVDLPSLAAPPGSAWVDAVGYALLTRVRVLVGELVVHDQERLFYDVTDRLFMPHARAEAVDRMIGRGRVLGLDSPHTVVVPLKFAWCANHYAKHQFLPLAGLAPRIWVEVTTDTLGRLAPGATAAVSSLGARLLSEQVWVGPDEQHALMRRPTTMLYETVQDVDSLSYQYDDRGTYDLASVRLDLRELNLPVKAIAIVAYDDNDAGDGVFFRYVDCVRRAALYVGSAEAFEARGGGYFGLVQPYDRGVRCVPDDNVYCFSFALRAGERQPSGSLNFATVENPSIRIDLQNTAGRAVKVKAFAYCYNWLEVAEGGLTTRFV